MLRWILLAGVATLVLAYGAFGAFRKRPGPQGGEVTQPPARPRPTAEQIAEVRAPLVSALEATRRPVAGVRFERIEEDDPLVSKLGGQPYLPRGESVPVDAKGHDMVLLAQIRFDELPQLAGYPRAGLLQVFISAHDDAFGMNLVEGEGFDELRRQRSFRTRYWPAPLLGRDQLARVRVPDTRGSTPHTPHRPRRMRFELGSEVITPLDVDFERVVGVNPFEFIEAEAERLGVEAEALGDGVFSSGQGSKVGGYPFFTQEDPRPSGGPDRLLLQLDTDDGAEMMWGDSGVGSFFAKPADVAEADFSSVAYTWDCY